MDQERGMTQAITAVSGAFSPRGPLEVAQFLDQKTQELAAVEALLHEAHETAEEAELRWTAHLDSIIALLESETEGKMPGEDLRLSIARQRGGWQKWRTYRKAERLTKVLEQRGRLISNQISAIQSEGRLLQAVNQ